MATDLTALKQRVVKRMRYKMETHTEDVFKIAKPIPETKSGVDITDYDGGNNYTAQNGATAPSASSIRAVKSSSNPIRYEIDIPITDDQLLDWEKAADDTADLLIERAWQKIVRMFWTLVIGARAVAHPEDGVSGSPLTAVGGGVMYVADNRTTTPINGGSAFDTSNDFTLAATPTNLRTVLNYRPGYRDRDGGATAPKKAKAFVYCVPDLAPLFRNWIKQQGQLFNGQGLVEGFAGEIEDVLVIPREVSTATDLWGVIWVSEVEDEGGAVSSEGPLLIQLRAAPKVEIEREPGAGFYHCYCSFNAGVWFHPTCHRDFTLSRP